MGGGTCYQYFELEYLKTQTIHPIMPTTRSMTSTARRTRNTFRINITEWGVRDRFFREPGLHSIRWIAPVATLGGGAVKNDKAGAGVEVVLQVKRQVG